TPCSRQQGISLIELRNGRLPKLLRVAGLSRPIGREKKQESLNCRRFCFIVPAQRSLGRLDTERPTTVCAWRKATTTLSKNVRHTVNDNTQEQLCRQAILRRRFIWNRIPFIIPLVHAKANRAPIDEKVLHTECS